MSEESVIYRVSVCSDALPFFYWDFEDCSSIMKEPSLAAKLGKLASCILRNTDANDYSRMVAEYGSTLVRMVINAFKFGEMNLACARVIVRELPLLLDEINETANEEFVLDVERVLEDEEFRVKLEALSFLETNKEEDFCETIDYVLGRQWRSYNE